MDRAPVIETKFLVFPLTHENMLPLATPAEVNTKMADIGVGWPQAHPTLSFSYL